MKQELKQIIGSVTDDPKMLETYSNDRSYDAGKKPALIVSPRTADEVQNLVRTARKRNYKLVPVSSTPPGFRGDSIPAVEGAVIVDLSGMKMIEWINRRNRVTVIEPGVTFGELEPELEKNGMRGMMPLCPRAGKSVVGAFMEREPFTVPKYAWDLGDPIASAELILGDGYKMRTGGGSGPAPTLEGQRKVGGAQKLPISPLSMDARRIAQGSSGSFAICTWQALRCELLPEHEKVYFAGADDPEKLIEAAYRFLYLRLTDEQFILNSLNFACLVEKDAAKIKALQKKLPNWIMVMSIGGYGTCAREQFDYKDTDLNSEAKALKVKLVTEIGGISEEDYRKKILRKVSEEPYWKLRLAGDVREIFFLTTLKKAPAFIKEAKEAAAKAGFDVNNIGVYLQQVIQGVACHCEFDLYAPEADMKKLEGFYMDLSTRIFNMGGYYSRPYGAWSDLVYPHAETFVKYAQGLKRIFDPSLIMNPEKLCFKGM